MLLPANTTTAWNRKQDVNAEVQRSTSVGQVSNSGMEVLDEQVKNHTVAGGGIVKPKEEGEEYADGSRSNSPNHNDENDGTSKPSNKADPKVCGVCGDRALGNNFNAITCESCKAFFRRNALKSKAFLCPFNDNCKVDPVTRRFCQKCRLKKCVEIGMKKEWIMTDEEKKMKKQKIEQNRLKRQSSDVPFGLEPPLSKVACLIDQNSPLSRSATPSPQHQNQNSPPDQLMSKGVKQFTNMANMTRSDFSDDQGFPIDALANGNKNMYTSAVACPSPSSSSCSNGSDMMYPAPPSLIGNQNMLPVEPPQYLSRSCRNGDTPSPVLMVNHQSHPEQGLGQQQQQHVWQSEAAAFHHQHSVIAPNPGLVNPYSIQHRNPSHNSSASSSPATLDKSVLYSGQGSSHSQAHKSTPSQGMGNSNMARASVSSEYTQPQMPLLSSLIRPGEAESPPDADLLDCSTSNIGSRAYSSTNPIAAPKDLKLKPASNYDAKLLSPISPVPNNEDRQQPQYNGPQQCVQDQPIRLMNKPEVEEDIPPPLPLNTMDSIMSVAITAEFNSFQMLGNGQEPVSNNLNRIERAKLRELLMASQALNAPVDEEGPIKVSETADPSLINVINLTDIAIRRIIKMSKKISGFKNMCQEDQIALLKGSCTEMMILRSAVSYDPDRDSWNIPHSFGYNIKLGVLKEARGNLYEEHQRFVRSFKPEWRADENIMIILCAITLFTAERPNVIHKDVVKLEQDSYYYLLRRYLESILNGCEARSTYLQLIRKIAELHVLNSNHLRVFLEVNPREVEPLLIEIFDLSSRR